MKFNKENKVIIESMDEAECRAFVKFLQSEIYRHLRDVADAEDLMREVRDKIRRE